MTVGSQPTWMVLLAQQKAEVTRLTDLLRDREIENSILRRRIEELEAEKTQADEIAYTRVHQLRNKVYRLEAENYSLQQTFDDQIVDLKKDYSKKLQELEKERLPNPQSIKNKELEPHHLKQVLKYCSNGYTNYQPLIECPQSSDLKELATHLKSQANKGKQGVNTFAFTLGEMLGSFGQGDVKTGLQKATNLKKFLTQQCSTLQKILNFLQSLFSTLWSWITKAFNWVCSMVKQLSTYLLTLLSTVMGLIPVSPFLSAAVIVGLLAAGVLIYLYWRRQGKQDADAADQASQAVCTAVACLESLKSHHDKLLDTRLLLSQQLMTAKALEKERLLDQVSILTNEIGKCSAKIEEFSLHDDNLDNLASAAA